MVRNIEGKSHNKGETVEDNVQVQERFVPLKGPLMKRVLHSLLE